MRAWFAVVSAVVLGGCGYVGDTKPPALNIPSPVVDLRAAEYGSNIHAEFTIPPLTTEGLKLMSVRSVELRASSGTESRSYSVPAKGPGALNYDFPAQEWIGKQTVLTVRATGPKGKISEWSNPVTLSIGSPVSTPSNVEAKNSPESVTLSWQGSAPQYRIFRSTGDMPPAQVGQSDQPEYKDSNIVYGTMYRYYVQGMDGALRQSEVSAPIEFTPKDVFPPAVPNGVTAVATTGAIELAWARNTESDLAGYNVYRAVDNGEFEKIANMIGTPAYSDHQVEAGKRYRYAVTSMDTVGNESAKSEVAEATAQ